MVAQATRRSRVLVHGESGGGLARIDGLLNEIGAEKVQVAPGTDLGRLLERDGIDLTLADAGWEVAHLEDLLRVIHARREVPVILVAHPGELSEFVANATRRFHVALLHKPTDDEELARALRHGLALRACHRDGHTLRERLHRAEVELDRCRCRRLEMRQESRRIRAELGRHRAEAEAEMKRRTWLLSAISHNLRTPVHEVALCCNLLESADCGPSDAAAWASMTAGLRDGVAWLRELVDDLVDIARLDLGTMPTRPVDLPIAPFLAQTLGEFSHEAARKGLAFHVSAEPPDAIAPADPVKLARIVRNLVSNAVKFTDAGSVLVQVRMEAGRGLIVEVSDTGCGIAPEQIASIFDEFAQVCNPERARAKGTGLGLALCRRLVASLGGRLEVDSQLGRGSTFTVTLPVEADGTES